MNTNYKICTRCIMDTSDPEIFFDEDGVCNHCHRYDVELPKRVFQGKIAKEKLTQIINKIKRSGKGKEYDCIIGVSGGVDSTYVAYLTKELGLRALAIHFDNGWNSELAVSNIEKVLDGLNIDLFTYVIDWEEFKDLQLSFLKASTPDGEIPTDHAINALLFREASKRGIKYIINGMNFATESMAIRMWAYGHSDWKYIKTIHELFGTSSLKRYPHYSFLNLFYWTFFKRIKVVSILNYVEYDKDKVMTLIQDNLGWVYYGGKHYESVYTRFFQGYILPKKFNIDKRIGHLSDLIRSRQLTRDKAIEELKYVGYDIKMKNIDLEFVMKKLDFDKESFEQLMNEKPKNFMDYPNSASKIIILKRLVNYLRAKGLYSK
ncbi:MAG: N-acetyl sugar amidotransferase [Bacteroidia bacterium]|nr:N-acetyl sugar amidotransferase [Bacteroidia bacterium]